MSRAVGLALMPALVVLALAGCTDRKAADTGASAMDTAMITTPAPAPAAVIPAPPPPDLRSRSDAFVAAWNRKNVAEVASFFATAATVHDPGGAYTGRADIRKRWLMPGMPTLRSLTVSDQTFIGTADSMTEDGSYREMIAQPRQAPAPHSGTYTITWVKTGADWMVKEMTVR